MPTDQDPEILSPVEFRRRLIELENLLWQRYAAREAKYADDPALQAEYQKDYREYIEEMSYGGETYNPNEGDRSEITTKK